MPEISRFYGIVIKMFFADHLPPHFHAEYQSYRSQISIRTGDLMEGEIPIKQLKLIQAWAILHEEELLVNFENLRSNPATWQKIKPLD
jgi:hypothetical protein